VVRTRIGSPYVIAAMNAARDSGDGLVCGYEANGGFLLGGDVRLHDHTLKALPTRDAVLPILTALVAAGKDGLAHLVRALPQRVTASDRLPDFLPARRHQLMAWLDPADREVRTARLQAAFSGLAGAPLLHVDDTDGIRMRFSNQCVIHLRASGNAPELRCYTEADAPETATALNRAALAWVSTQFSG